MGGGHAKVEIYHARQRLPALKKQLSTFDYDKQVAQVESLETARQLSPACVSALAKEAAHGTEIEMKGNLKGADLQWACVPRSSLQRRNKKARTYLRREGTVQSGESRKAEQQMLK